MLKHPITSKDESLSGKYEVIVTISSSQNEFLYDVFYGKTTLLHLDLSLKMHF